eukprot:TRINITY_DN4163_c0_g1_i1.p1 TRINITY_DN4163_c0_g1~~TRINITY_DN4163_c0_g1_i1.p1  ORF type:complete len:310 (-),score=26.79 TRINITY_DN4163_c0_g1_i1:372-1277(-)
MCVSASLTCLHLEHVCQHYKCEWFGQHWQAAFDVESRTCGCKAEISGLSIYVPALAERCFVAGVHPEICIMASFAAVVDMELPLKNTFIHFDTSDSDESPVIRRCEKTCPDLIQRLPSLGCTASVYMEPAFGEATESDSSESDYSFGPRHSERRRHELTDTVVLPGSKVSFAAADEVELPLKNTFIHFDTSDSDTESPAIRRSEKTCPDLVESGVFRTKSSLRRMKAASKLALHVQGHCRPCAYFAFKGDGCRMGEDCEFCHLCDRTETRRWKRARAKCLKVLGIEDDAFIRLHRYTSESE